MSDPLNNLLRGQRPSPDGEIVTTPTLPPLALSHNSVANVTGTDVSVIDPIAQEGDLNDMPVVGSNGLVRHHFHVAEGGCVWMFVLHGYITFFLLEFDPTVQ